MGLIDKSWAEGLKELSDIIERSWNHIKSNFINFEYHRTWTVFDMADFIEYLWNKMNESSEILILYMI